MLLNMQNRILLWLLPYSHRSRLAIFLWREDANDGLDCTAIRGHIQMIQYLIEHRDQVVGKDEIIKHIWSGRIVSDGTLTSRINSVRRAVDDDGKAQAVIKTFPRRGLRFVAELNETADTAQTP